MFSYLGVFDTERAARDAHQKLLDLGLNDSRALLASDFKKSGGGKPMQTSSVADEDGQEDDPSPMVSSVKASSVVSGQGRDAGEAVAKAVSDGLIPGGNARQCQTLLENGRSLVAVFAVFGYGDAAINILEEKGELVESVRADDPSPFSDWFGIPTLSRSRPSANLTSSSWTFSSIFGLGLLSKDQSKPVIGVKTLSGKQAGWTSSLGLPILAGAKRPYKSLLGLKTLTGQNPPGQDKDWSTSLGFPTLSRNPAPLSSLFGIPTLSRKRPDNGPAKK